MRIGGQVIFASLVSVLAGSVNIETAIIRTAPIGSLNGRCGTKYEVELLGDMLAGMTEVKRSVAGSRDVDILKILDDLGYFRNPVRQTIRQRLARLLGSLYVTESSLFFMLELNHSGRALTSNMFHEAYRAFPAFQGKGSPGSYIQPSNCQLQRWYKRVLEPRSGMTLSAAGIHPIMKVNGETVYAPSVSDMLALCDMEMSLMVPRQSHRLYKKRKSRDSLDSSPETSVESRMDELGDSPHGRSIPIPSGMDDPEWDFLDFLMEQFVE
jgi:hypothetical protein